MGRNSDEGGGREWSSEQQRARDERERDRRVERPEPGRYEREERQAMPAGRDERPLDLAGGDRVPASGWERPDYGFGQRGMEERSDWRGPGEMSGYRQNRDPGRTRAFSASASIGGQAPSEIREWGRGGERGERRIQSEYPMREPWRHGPAGLGPDADRGPDGQRRSLGGPTRDPGRERPGGPHAGLGPKSYRRGDTRIHEDVCDQLMAHPRIDASEIEVAVDDGKVVLRGSVPDRATKHRAEDLVETVLGVAEVDNQLRVGRRGGLPPAAPSDAGQH